MFSRKVKFNANMCVVFTSPVGDVDVVYGPFKDSPEAASWAAENHHDKNFKVRLLWLKK